MFHSSRSRFVLIAAAILAFHWTALLVFFGVDDFIFLVESRHPGWPGVVAALGGRYLSQKVAFAANLWLFGHRAWAHHLPALGLHVLNAWLIYRLFERVQRRGALSFAAALLYAIHPATVTVMSFVSAGLEETPTVTLTLLAVHLFLEHLRRANAWSLAAALCLAILACGFKSHAVATPLYLAAFAAIALRRERAAPRRFAWAAVLLLPFALFSLWYVAYVLPRFPITNPAYATDFSAASLWHSYLRLLANIINVLPVAREAIGYQQSLPAGFQHWIGDGLWFRAAVVAAGALLCGYSAWRLGEGMLAASLFVVVIATQLFAASIPRHLYDYYSFYALPAACGLLALPIAALSRTVGSHVGHRRGRQIAAAAVVAYAGGAGWVFHSTNDFIMQAENARLVDRFVSGRLHHGQDLVFAPPSDRAFLDSTYGVELEALRGDLGSRVLFLKDTDSGPNRSTPRTQLAALDRVGGRDYAVYALDGAAWLRPYRTGVGAGGEIVQPFDVVSNGFSEVQVLVSATWGATVIAEVSIVDAAGGGTRLTRLAVVTMRIPAGQTPRYYPIPVPRQADSAGKHYELALRVLERGGPLGFSGTSPQEGVLPLRRRLSAGGDWSTMGTPPGEAMVYRVVVTNPDRSY
jgi:hypothetical protein